MSTKAEELFSEGLMTVNEVMEFLSLSRSGVWKLMSDGRLSYTRIGGARRIPRVAVRRLVIKGLSI